VTIKINTFDDMRSIINNLKIEHIGENKSTRKEELYLVLRLLSTDMKKINLTFPYIIEVKDKPDIRIIKDSYVIGIEITFALNKTLQKAKKIRDKLNSSFLLEPSLYKDDMSAKDIKKTILKSNEKLIGSAYVDDELEEEVSQQVLSSIKEKIKKYRGYEVFQENYLMLYSDILLADINVVLEKIDEGLKLINDIPFNKIIFRLQNKNFFYS